MNADDKFLNKWVSKIQCPVLTFGMRHYAEISAEVIEQTSSEQTFLLVAGNETVPVRTKIIGDFFVRHCLAATTLGLTLGLSLEDIISGLESVESIPGRMERVERGQDFSVFVDAARTPNQLCAMLKSLARVQETGKIRCVFGGADRVTAEQRAGLGTIAERYADQAIITGVDVHNESALEVAHEILDGFDDVAKANVIPNRAAAIRHALEQSQPGDMVLVAGIGEKSTKFGFHSELEMTDRQMCDSWFDDPNSLDSLISSYSEDLPVSYPIDNYR